MEKTKDPHALQSTLSPAGPLGAACDAFQAQLQQGRRPAIEQFLDGWEEPERSKLLFELLRLEIDWAYLHGEEASQREYAGRFPDHPEVVEEAFLATLSPEHSDETLSMTSSYARRGFLGKGGLGIVYVAEDQQLKRDTAVKFIQDTVADNPRSQEQFRLEAEITSRLEHPGIVPVHGLGETADGRLFYVMRRVRGERFDEAIARYHQQSEQPSADAGRRQVEFHELLQHFAAVCKTVAYAHNRGVVHRDLKPANIMLGRYGETLVIDWGLAAHVGRKGVFKDSNEKTLMPGSGSGSSQNSGGGTPPYMSPEQAAGRDELGPPSDIYSLGATLYTLLTGKVPVTGRTSAEVMEKVTRGEFPRPAQVRKGVSRALEAICLKAMSLDPDRRYGTALELAEDVGRYLADAPVTAYQEPFTRRMARWARRHRTTAQTVLVTLVLLAAAGSAAAVWWGRQAQRERRLHAHAETARENEESLRKQSLQVWAEFAARTLANQIDIRWRILEKEAADPELHALLRQINAEPQNGELRRPLQERLDRIAQEEYAEIPTRGWFIQANEGTQVARFPSRTPEGEPMPSLGRNYAFRDYFHGRGEDFPPDRPFVADPLARPYNSAVHISTNDGDLNVNLSVPIRGADDEPLGVLAMSIELGRFADLEIDLPQGQGILLVESRKYYMLTEDLQPHGERGEGLVLHHERLKQVFDQRPLPHVDDGILNVMLKARPRWAASPAQRRQLNNLLPETYRDPLANGAEGQWLAAFAPVLVHGRSQGQADTGWFVIVQQQR